MQINFQFHDRHFSLLHRKVIKALLLQLFKKHSKEVIMLTYIFTSDDFIKDINNRYLKHNYYTDIITFDLSDEFNSVTADIYISVDRVKENAKHFSTSFETEMKRVIFHGALHLCGYKDKSRQDKELMRKAEDYYIKKTNTY